MFIGMIILGLTLTGCVAGNGGARFGSPLPKAGDFSANTTVLPSSNFKVVMQARKVDDGKLKAALASASASELHRVSMNGMSMSHAVGVAISRHPSISQAHAVVAQTSSEVAIAKAAWYPTLEYGMRPGLGQADGHSVRTAGISGSLGINQLVYDFGRTPNIISAAEATLSQKRHLFVDTIETVAYNTAAIFIELAAAQDTESAAKRQVASLRDTSQKIVDRVKAGLSDTTDQNLADVAIQRAEAEVFKARTRLDVATGRLAELIGVRPVRVANLKATQTFATRLGQGGTDIEDTPAVRAADAALDAARAKVRVAEADRWPQIGAGLSQSRSTEASNSNDKTFIGVTIGGRFSFGGLAQNKILAAEAEQSAASHNLENQRLVTRTALGSAELEASGASARLASYEKVISLTKSQRELSWQEYTLNKRPLTDVISAEREIYQAEVEKTNAVADGILACIKVHTATGQFVTLLREYEKSRS